MILEIIFGLVLCAMLITLAVIDFRHFRLPNALTFPLMALGLLQAYLLKFDIPTHLIGIGAGYFVFVGVELGFKYLRGKDGLGRGDAKLLAAGGAWCGWMALPYIVLFSSLMGIAMASAQKQKSAAIPFGPALAVGVMTVWLTLRFTHILTVQ